ARGVLPGESIAAAPGRGGGRPVAARRLDRPRRAPRAPQRPERRGTLARALRAGEDRGARPGGARRDAPSRRLRAAGSPVPRAYARAAEVGSRDRLSHLGPGG